MCGIAGVYERAGCVASADVALAMAGELHHRGPDGTGLYLDDRLAMVNTRLSIVDLAGGDQPIGNEDGRYWVVHNGEIYNHPELREELQDLGHRFATHCDTEVLVHAYEQWGADCVHHLNGAFAFALWDRKTARLFLARDRLGIRPLFISEVNGTFLFASEGKALLRHPAVERRLDPVGLLETFSLWATAPDCSALRGVRELAPGSYMVVGPEGIEHEQVYWDVHFEPSQEFEGRSESDLADELLALLEDATRLRLRADVPVSAYLSGGLDSSTIAAMIRRTTDVPRRFFAVRFEDARFDEGEFQDRMARELQTDLTSLSVGGKDIAEAFPEVIRLSEKPMFRTAPAPMLLLSRMVHDAGFKVVLTGEGADEVFAGYNIFREAKVRRFWARQPESELRPLLLRRLYPYLARDLGRTGAFLKRFFARGMMDVDDPLYSHRLRFENGRRVSGLLHPQVLDEAHGGGSPETRLIGRLPGAFASFGPLGKAQYLELHTFMQGYLLHSQGDRMLMGNSVEGRFPFLDHRLAEFAARVPERLRMRALEEKYLLRRAAAPLLPRDIMQRSKRPYRAPILSAFIGSHNPEYVDALLSESHLRETGLFEPRAVQLLVQKCRKRVEQGVSESDEMALVGVLSTLLLHRSLVTDPSLAAPAVATRLVVGADIKPPSRLERTS